MALAGLAKVAGLAPVTDGCRETGRDTDQPPPLAVNEASLDGILADVGTLALLDAVGGAVGGAVSGTWLDSGIGVAVPAVLTAKEVCRDGGLLETGEAVLFAMAGATRDGCREVGVGEGRVAVIEGCLDGILV